MSGVAQNPKASSTGLVSGSGRAQNRVRSRGSGRSGAYPGSRQARLSGTARVAISSLGAGKAAGPPLSRGSLHRSKWESAGAP